MEFLTCKFKGEGNYSLLTIWTLKRIHRREGEYVLMTLGSPHSIPWWSVTLLRASTYIPVPKANHYLGIE